MTEVPTITKSAYATSSVSGHELLGLVQPQTVTGGHVLHAAPGVLTPRRVGAAPMMGAMYEEDVQLSSFGRTQKEKAVSLRFVKIYIVDPTDDLKLEDRVLYRGEEQLTDLTDQELFFELPIKDLLEKHNTKRVGVLNKRASEKAGKDVFLEPVRVRDLKMSVTDVAKF